MMARAWFPDRFAELIPLLLEEPAVWLVGGAIRDSLLERPTRDYDFVLAGDALALGRRAADRLGGSYYTLDAERGTGRVLLHDADGDRWTLDFARLRGSDIRADLEARDFTLNALAVELHDPDALIDPTHGLRDIKDKRLRACGPHSIDDDPIRALRAVRLASELGLRIEPAALDQFHAAARRLPLVSWERIRDEFLRLLDLPRPGRPLRVLDHLGLLAVVCPELGRLRDLQQPPPHALDAWNHTLAVIDRLGDLLLILGPRPEEEGAANLLLAQAVLRLGKFRVALHEHLQSSLSQGRSLRQLLYLAALYHDAGKPAARSLEDDGRTRFFGHEAIGADLAAERGRTLRLAADEVDHVARVVRHHMRPAALEASGTITHRAVYRFFRDTGQAGTDILLLSLADLLGTHVPAPPQGAWESRVEVCRLLLEALFEGPPERIRPTALLRGDDLVRDLDLRPGPIIGRLLEAIREAQTGGEVTSRGEALALARRLLAQEDDQPGVDEARGA